MSFEALIAEVLRVAGELGLTTWERIAAILAVALLLVLGRRGIAVLRKVQIESPEEPVEPNVGPNGEAPGTPGAPGPVGDTPTPVDGSGAGGG